eukprot:13894088-Heterocapsa_arctica.AAC.1
MMALIDGRLIPHGKHADLHRRAIDAYEHGPLRTLRVKWVPSHMAEDDIAKGKITREDKEGNEEADKLATRGVELHKVPKHLVQEVARQDVLVEGLLKIMLSVMSNVHDKAPVRKKEEKLRQEEVQRKYQGPKTGPHGEHTFVDKEGGRWKCMTCGKFSTTYLGWKRLVRSPCRVKKMTNRAKWKTVFHRRKWLQRAERKIGRGDLTENHSPIRVLERDGYKWLCVKCGAFAKRHADLGGACFGPPTQGSCRFWRMQQKRLTRFQLDLPITSGRNESRSGPPAAPAETGQILRLFREGAAPINGHQQAEEPPGSATRKGKNHREAAKTQPRAGKRKLVPQPIQGEYEGTPLTGSQELRRLFAPKAAVQPPETLEEFPELAHAEPASGSGASNAVPQGRKYLEPRTRSRTPARSAWDGSAGRHTEAAKAEKKAQHRTT